MGWPFLLCVYNKQNESEREEVSMMFRCATKRNGAKKYIDRLAYDRQKKRKQRREEEAIPT